MGQGLAACDGSGERRDELPRDPQRDTIFIPQSRDVSDVLDHATSEITSGSKLGIDATKKIPGEGFKCPWRPLIKMDAAVKAKVNALFGNGSDNPPMRS